MGYKRNEDMFWPFAARICEANKKRKDGDGYYVGNVCYENSIPIRTMRTQI